MVYFCLLQRGHSMLCVTDINQLMRWRSGCTVRFDTRPRLLLSDRSPSRMALKVWDRFYAPPSLYWSSRVSVSWSPLSLLSNARTGLLLRRGITLRPNLRYGSPFCSYRIWLSWCAFSFSANSVCFLFTFIFFLLWNTRPSLRYRSYCTRYYS